MNSRALRQLTLMRLREFIREPEAVFWTLLFPVLLTTGLGIAFRNKPADVLRVAAVSPEIVAALTSEPQLAVETLSADSANDALRVGRVALVAEPGPGATVVYRFDETNPEGRFARLLADAAVQRHAGRTDPIGSANVLIREPGSRYIDFLVPGVVGLGVMSNALWGLGFAIVDARRRKLTKRLAATPMSHSAYLGSFLIWRLVMLVVEIAVPIGFGALVFGVPVRGSWFALIVTCTLGSFAFSALGLLLASRPRTIEGVSGLVNLAQIPMWVLSGVFFSAQRFPAFAQPFIKALPLTAFNDALRAHMLQGASLASLAPSLAVLAAWLVVCFPLALLAFRWK